MCCLPQGALELRTQWISHELPEVSHMKAARMFRFLAQYCTRLQHISCCFASDHLYGGSLLESSLISLASSCHQLSSVVLLNVDVTDE